MEKLVFLVVGILVGIVLSTSFSGTDLLTGAVINEKPSPSTHLTLEDISLYSSGIFINTQNASLLKFSDTSSMEPTLDEHTVGIIVPISAYPPGTGDIIVYQTAEGKKIAHRIIAVKEYNEKKHYTVRGDNVPTSDGYLVPIDAVEGVIVGLVYT